MCDIYALPNILEYSSSISCISFCKLTIANWCVTCGSFSLCNPNHSNGGVAFPSSFNRGSSIIGGANAEYLNLEDLSTFSIVSFIASSIFEWYLLLLLGVPILL